MPNTPNQVTIDPRQQMCKDCIHYQYFRLEGEEICGRRAKLLNPVNGEVVDNYDHRRVARCAVERSLWVIFAVIFRTCGSRARFFQKRS